MVGVSRNNGRKRKKKQNATGGNKKHKSKKGWRYKTRERRGPTRRGGLKGRRYRKYRGRQGVKKTVSAKHASKGGDPKRRKKKKHRRMNQGKTMRK